MRGGVAAWSDIAIHRSEIFSGPRGARYNQYMHAELPGVDGANLMLGPQTRHQRVMVAICMCCRQLVPMMTR
jgi:hypothetical protein